MGHPRELPRTRIIVPIDGTPNPRRVRNVPERRPSPEQFNHTWKTPTTVGCFVFRLGLADGATYAADFKLQVTRWTR